MIGAAAMAVDSAATTPGAHRSGGKVKNAGFSLALPSIIYYWLLVTQPRQKDAQGGAPPTTQSEEGRYNKICRRLDVRCSRKREGQR